MRRIVRLSGAGVDPAVLAGGVYVAALYLPEPCRRRLGGLGRCELPAGWYFYVGSAQAGLGHRLRRHARRRKVRHWHIDYLTAVAPLRAAVVFPGPQALECALARALARRFATPVPRFGASDCTCPTHLFHLPVKP